MKAVVKHAREARAMSADELHARPINPDAPEQLTSVPGSPAAAPRRRPWTPTISPGLRPRWVAEFAQRGRVYGSRPSRLYSDSAFARLRHGMRQRWSGEPSLA